MDGLWGVPLHEHKQADQKSHFGSLNGRKKPFKNKEAKGGGGRPELEKLSDSTADNEWIV